MNTRRSIEVMTFIPLTPYLTVFLGGKKITSDRTEAIQRERKRKWLVWGQDWGWEDWIKEDEENKCIIHRLRQQRGDGQSEGGNETGWR